MIDSGVLVRNVTAAAGLDGCLRVTSGTREKNDQFVQALERSLSAWKTLSWRC